LGAGEGGIQVAALRQPARTGGLRATRPLVQMGWLKVPRYQRGWMIPADFTNLVGEPDA